MSKMEFLLSPKLILKSPNLEAISKEYASLKNKIEDSLVNYNKSVYKNLKYEVFETSIDYLKQKVLITINFLENTVDLNEEVEGLILQQLICDLDNISNKKLDFLLKLNKFFKRKRENTTLFNTLNELEKNSSDLDSVLHLEKLCSILKNIFELEENIQSSTEINKLIQRNNEKNSEFQTKKLNSFNRKYIKKINYPQLSNNNPEYYKKEIIKPLVRVTARKVQKKDQHHGEFLLEESLNGAADTLSLRQSLFKLLKKPTRIYPNNGDNENNSKKLFGEIDKVKEIRNDNKEIVIDSKISKETEEIKNPDLLEIVEEEKKDYLFYIQTKIGDEIHFNELYGTDDQDRVFFTDLINEPINGGRFEHVVKEENINVYRRDIEGKDIILIKAISLINFDRDTVFKAISDVSIRKEWDKVFNEFKIIESSEEREVLYSKIIGPFTVADREFVQQRKIWRNFPDNNTICIHFKSIDHNDIPIKKKVVRAETIISGYFIRTISLNPPRTKLISVSQTDIKVISLFRKGNIPKFIVNPIASRAPKDWILNLNKGCKMVLKIK